MKWATDNNMQINTEKVKVMEVYFGKSVLQQDNITMQGNKLESVKKMKVLGVVINDKLDWSDHVSYITAKANKRVYFLCLLLRAGIPKLEVLEVYYSLVRSVLEYAAEVWHGRLTKDQSEKIEHIQNRTVKLIFPDEDHTDICQKHGIVSLKDRREERCEKLYKEIQNPGHKLHHLLPNQTNKRTLRETSTRKYEFPAKSTNRFLNSPINYSIRTFQKDNR